MDVAELPIDCLLRVFSHVDFGTRQSALPLVCRSWRNALAVPSSAWQDVVVRAKLKLTYYNGTQVTEWFRQRVGCITRVAVTDLHFPIQEVVDSLAEQMGPCIEELRTRMPFGGTQLARLAACPFTQLRCLHAEVKSKAEGRLLAQLPALTELKVIQYMEMHGGILDSLTALSKLSYLSLMTAGGLPEGMADRLPHLKTLCLMEHVGNELPAEVLRMGPHLTALQLKTFLFHDPIQIPHQLTQLTGLKNLWLSDVRLPTMLLSALTGLTALALVECGLNAVPDLRPLSNSLRGLALTGNRIVTLPGWLGDLQALEEVDINQQEDRVALDVDVLEKLLPPLQGSTGSSPSSAPALHLSVTYTSAYYNSPMPPAPAWGKGADSSSSSSSGSGSGSNDGTSLATGPITVSPRSGHGCGADGGAAAAAEGKHFRSLYVDRSRRYWMTCGGFAVPLQHHKHAFQFLNWPPPASAGLQQQEQPQLAENKQAFTTSIGGGSDALGKLQPQQTGNCAMTANDDCRAPEGKGCCSEVHAVAPTRSDQVARMEAALARLNACTRFYLSAIAGMRHF